MEHLVAELAKEIASPVEEKPSEGEKDASPSARMEGPRQSAERKDHQSGTLRTPSVKKQQQTKAKKDHAHHVTTGAAAPAVAPMRAPAMELVDDVDRDVEELFNSKPVVLLSDGHTSARAVDRAAAVDAPAAADASPEKKKKKKKRKPRGAKGIEAVEDASPAPRQAPSEAPSEVVSPAAGPSPRKEPSQAPTAGRKRPRTAVAAPATSPAHASMSPFERAVLERLESIERLLQRGGHQQKRTAVRPRRHPRVRYRGVALDSALPHRNPPEQAAAQQVCFRCGQPGHRKAACPDTNGSGTGPPQ